MPEALWGRQSALIAARIWRGTQSSVPLSRTVKLSRYVPEEEACGAVPVVVDEPVARMLSVRSGPFGSTLGTKGLTRLAVLLSRLGSGRSVSTRGNGAKWQCGLGGLETRRTDPGCDGSTGVVAECGVGAASVLGCPMNRVDKLGF